MLRRPLSHNARVAAFAGGSSLIVLMTAVAASVATRWPIEPIVPRIIAVAAVSGVTALGAVLINMARCGYFDRRRDNHLFMAIALAMLFSIGIAVLRQGFNTADLQSVFAGSVFLTLCGLAFILHVFEQHHFTTLERLESLERRLAKRD